MLSLRFVGGDAELIGTCSTGHRLGEHQDRTDVGTDGDEQTVENDIGQLLFIFRRTHLNGQFPKLSQILAEAIAAGVLGGACW